MTAAESSKKLDQKPFGERTGVGESALLPRNSSATRRVAGLAALLAASVICFAPALRGDFIWDDRPNIRDNDELRSWSGLATIWTTPSASYQYYPLTLSFFWLQYQAWGDHPFGYHLISTLLHGINAFLLWRVLARLEVPGAFVAAAVFCVHPLQVDTVAWASEQKNLWSMLLALLATREWLRIGDGRDRFHHGLAFGCFMGALFAKTVICGLPIVLLMVSWWRRPERLRHDARRLVLWVFAAVAIAAVTIARERSLQTAAFAPFGTVPWEMRPALAGRALLYYIRQTLWPDDLLPIYPRWSLTFRDWLFPALVLVIVAVAWKLIPIVGRGPLVAIVSYGLLLAPTLGLIPFTFQNHSFVADHFQYHAGPALMALMIAGLFGTFHLGHRTWIFAQSVISLLLVLLSAMTFHHARVYASPETLWRRTLERNPEAWAAHGNLANRLTDRGEFNRAAFHYEQALAIVPNHPGILASFAHVRFQQGQRAEAIELCRQTLQSNPNHSTVNRNLVRFLEASGQEEEAVNVCLAAFGRRPDLTVMVESLGEALMQRKQYPLAERLYRGAAAVLPRHADFRFRWGQMLARVGQPDDAIIQCQIALQLDPRHVDAHGQIGMLLAQKGSLSEAATHFRKAILLAPASADLRNNYAMVLLMQGNREGAKEQWETALRFDPRHASARSNLERVRHEPPQPALVPSP